MGNEPAERLRGGGGIRSLGLDTKLRSGDNLRIGVDFSVTLPADAATGLRNELRQTLLELGLGEALVIE